MKKICTATFAALRACTLTYEGNFQLNLQVSGKRPWVKQAWQPLILINTAGCASLRFLARYLLLYLLLILNL